MGRAKVDSRYLAHHRTQACGVRMTEGVFELGLGLSQKRLCGLEHAHAALGESRDPLAMILRARRDCNIGTGLDAVIQRLERDPRVSQAGAADIRGR